MSRSAVNRGTPAGHGPLVGDPEGIRLYADDMGTNEAFVVDLTPDGRVLYAVPAYQRLAAGGGGRTAAHRAELAKR
jgi:hypothetical protein